MIKNIVTNDNKRQSNIELLRIISMFMVLVLHYMGQGGVLKSVPMNSVNYYMQLNGYAKRKNIFSIKC